jgi:membrane protease YdiL (CAAX protease family)
MASPSTQPAVASSAPAQMLPDVTRRRRVEDLGLVMLVGFAPLVVSAVYLLFVSLPFPSGYTNFRFASGLTYEVVTLTLFLCLLRRQGRTLSTIGLTFHWTDIPAGFGLFLLSYLGSYVFIWRAQKAYFFWHGTYFHFRDSAPLYAGASFVLFAVYCTAAPFFEETLVRGYLMTELIGISCPVWMAAIASTVLQTTYHLYYGIPGALFVGFGFALSSIYFALSRKLAPVILSHLFWNLTATYLHLRR